MALAPTVLGSDAYRGVSGLERGFDLVLTVLLAPVVLIVGRGDRDGGLYRFARDR